MKTFVQNLETVATQARMTAMLAGRNAVENFKATVLATLLNEIKQKGYTKTGYVELSDDKAISMFIEFQKSVDQSVKLTAVSAPNRLQLETEQACLMEFAEQFLPKNLTEEIDLDSIITTLIADNRDKAESVKEKPGNIGWFTGQVMKATNGRANSKEVIPRLKIALGVE